MEVRLATAADTAAVLAIYGPVVESTAISFETAVPGPDEVARRIVERQPAHPWLVADDAGAVAGYAYAGRFASRAAYDWSVETSVYIHEARRGQGVGRTLYAALLAVLEAQGYRQAMAGIALPNAASVGLHEAMGFRPVGVYQAAGWKFGRWHDVGWWQRPIGDGAATPPRPPTTLDALGPGVLARALAVTA